MVRLKVRYLICEVTFENDEPPRHKKTEVDVVGPPELFHAIKNEMGVQFGDFGLGLVMQSLQVIYYNRESKLAVVRCCRDYASNAQGALTIIKNIKNKDVKIRTIKICGCGRTCKSSLLTLSKEKLSAASDVNDKLHQTIQDEIIALSALL